MSKTRQVIKDEELTGSEKYVVDWDGLNSALLDAREYLTQLLYDGLNRVRLSILPEEVSDDIIGLLPKELIPTYNRAGALQSIAFAGTEHVRHIAYNAKGQRVLMAMGNDMMTRYAYDPITFRLQRIRTEGFALNGNTYEYQNGSTKQDTAYEYDHGGNIIKIKERVSECGIVGTPLGANALDKLFTYDPLKRLLTATGRESSTTNANHLWDDTPVNSDLSATRAYTQHFTYDKLGNILLLDHDATGNNYNRYYRYTGGKNLLEQIDNNGSPADVYSTFEYDANGNLISSNTDRHYEWDTADQLRYFKIFDGSTITKQAHYLYAGGQRVKKVVRTGTALEITVYIDGVYEHRYKALVGISTLSPQHQNNYFVMDGRSRIATVRLGHAWGDTAPELCYNLEDHLGTSTTRLTSDGTGVDREEYYPFGDSSLRTIDKKRYRYVGKERDEESGLYYYGARYYAAWVGRFVSVDPLGFKFTDLSPYNYSGNSPIESIDLDGLQQSDRSPEPCGGENSIMAQPPPPSVSLAAPPVNAGPSESTNPFLAWLDDVFAFFFPNDDLESDEVYTPRISETGGINNYREDSALGKIERTIGPYADNLVCTIHNGNIFPSFLDYPATAEDILSTIHETFTINEERVLITGQFEGRFFKETISSFTQTTFGEGNIALTTENGFMKSIGLRSTFSYELEESKSFELTMEIGMEQNVSYSTVRLSYENAQQSITFYGGQGLVGDLIQFEQSTRTGSLTTGTRHSVAYSDKVKQVLVSIVVTIILRRPIGNWKDVLKPSPIPALKF